MKKYKYIILTILLFPFCLNKVYADCSTEELATFKKIEDKYTYSYEFDKTTKTYTVMFHNEMPDRFKYEFDAISNVDCSFTNNEQTDIKCQNLASGEYEIRITGRTTTCDEALKSENVNMAYNKYSEDPLCQGIEEFVLCSPSYDKEITRDSFESRVASYKKTKETTAAKKDNDPVDEPASKVVGIIEQIKGFVIDNLKYILLGLFAVIVITIVIIIISKSQRKRRRLE